MKNHTLLLWILGTGVFGILNTEMGMIGILPYIAENFAVPISEAGLLISLFAFVVAVAGPTMPLILSRFNRKTVMLIVLGIFVVANLISAFTTNFGVLLAARVIPAFFHPVYCSLAFVAAAASVPEKQAPDAVGKVMIGTAAGMVVGVPVSNWLAVTFSLQVALLFFAVVTAIAFLTTLVFVPSLPVTERLTYGSQLRVLKRRKVWLAILAIILMNGAIFGVFSYLADYLRQAAQLPDVWVSPLLFVYGFANVIGSFFSGRLIVWNPKRLFFSYPLVLTAVYLLITIGNHQLYLLAALILFWGIIGGINANMNQFLITRAAPEAKDFASGLFLTSANIGTMLGTMLSGYLISTIGMQAIVISGIVFALASLPFLAGCFADKQETSKVSLGMP